MNNQSFTDYVSKLFRKPEETVEHANTDKVNDEPSDNVEEFDNQPSRLNIFSSSTKAGADMAKDPDKEHEEASSSNFPALNSRIAQAVEYTNKQVSLYKDQEISLLADSLISEARGLAVDAAKTYMNAVMQISLAAQAVLAEKALESLTDKTIDDKQVETVLQLITKMIGDAVKTFQDVEKS